MSYFREDFFDPVSRIRRGRIYKRGDGGQPRQWHVLSHPNAYSYSYGTDYKSGLEERRLYSYDSCSISREIGSANVDSTIVVLGVGEAYSLWTIIGFERIASDEEVITLKARQSFGILPRINWDKVPESFRAKVRETTETLLDDVHRAGPESVVDRCRDAAAAILRAHLGDVHAGKDLGQLIRELLKEDEKKNIVIASSDIIRIFHPRAKPNEQERRPLRPLREQDAELSVQCVGAILCELGWAEWQ